MCSVSCRNCVVDRVITCQCRGNLTEHNELITDSWLTMTSTALGWQLVDADAQTGAWTLQSADTDAADHRRKATIDTHRWLLDVTVVTSDRRRSRLTDWAAGPACLVVFTAAHLPSLDVVSSNRHSGGHELLYGKPHKFQIFVRTNVASWAADMSLHNALISEAYRNILSLRHVHYTTKWLTWTCCMKMNSQARQRNHINSTSDATKSVDFSRVHPSETTLLWQLYALLWWPQIKMITELIFWHMH